MILIFIKKSQFEGAFSVWKNTSKNIAGYSDPIILRKVFEAASKAKNDASLFERDSVLFKKNTNVPTYLNVLLSAYALDKKLIILDFGGSLGSAYYLYKPFLLHLKYFRWCIVEQKSFVEVGKKHFSDEHLFFYEDISKCIKDNSPNLIFLASSIQYIQHPFKILDIVNKSKAEYLILDRTPFSNLSKDFITKQNVPAHIYNSSYLMWIFSEKLMLTRLLKSWKIIYRKNSISEQFFTKSIPILRFHFHDFVFTKK
nr:methyltransferase, TIGR04325 family [Candidatus Methylopumilus universalis]